VTGIQSIPQNRARSHWDGRWLALLIALLFALLFWQATRIWGIERTLDAAGVPPIGTSFGDLYLFPAAAHGFAVGGNPYLSNPSDPWRRLYNYPRIWLSFMRFSFRSVPWVGLTLDAAWLAALAIVWGRLSVGEGAVAGLLAISPAALLALERANSDLIIFLLIVLALLCLRQRWNVPAWLIYLACGVLKIFPIAAALTFLRGGWRRAVWWIGAELTALGLWALLRKDEIRLVLRNTPDGGPGISYGATVLTTIANQNFGARTGNYDHFDSYRWIASFVAGALVLMLGWAGWRRSSGGWPLSSPEKSRAESTPDADPKLDAFRAGGAIYLLTFVAGSNFDYRRIFLLLCLPWLWPRAAGSPFRILKLITLGCVIFGLWANTDWTDWLIVPRELADWTLLAVLTWLLGATLPIARRQRS